LIVGGVVDGDTVYKPRVTLHGRVSTGARLKLNGKGVKTGAGRWRISVGLHTGNNLLRFRAIKPGFRPASTQLTVVRRLPQLQLDLAASARSQVIDQPTLALSGTVTHGATVSANGTAADVSGNHWSASVPVHVGHNYVTVKASEHGFRATSTTLEATRHVSQAEYEASATTIPYDDLLKDSSPYRGKVVSFRGQVFQIQQFGNRGGIMLLSVTDDGYGLWTDNVWVDYDHSTPANENDIVTVYGTVTGTKSYQTQGGGETYVPRMHAKYIDMTG
jgi:hypothetical protein